ncbi:MAG TPA: hypothetical protein VK700_03715 [Steroidobacteraceae bacterium]|jgi:hypothetical protein|nr:hypothetical protein [Steroidobacteraceae bacterium]
MSDIENLTILRDRLVARRRALVSSLLRAAPEQLTGEAISRIQSAVEAVQRAIEEERLATNRARRSG